MGHEKYNATDAPFMKVTRAIFFLFVRNCSIGLCNVYIDFTRILLFIFVLLDSVLILEKTKWFTVVYVCFTSAESPGAVVSGP